MQMQVYHKVIQKCCVYCVFRFVVAIFVFQPAHWLQTFDLTRSEVKIYNWHFSLVATTSKIMQIPLAVQ